MKFFKSTFTAVTIIQTLQDWQFSSAVQNCVRGKCKHYIIGCHTSGVSLPERNALRTTCFETKKKLKRPHELQETWLFRSTSPPHHSLLVSFYGFHSHSAYNHSHITNQTRTPRKFDQCICVKESDRNSYVIYKHGSLHVNIPIDHWWKSISECIPVLLPYQLIAGKKLYVPYEQTTWYRSFRKGSIIFRTVSWNPYWAWVTVYREIHNRRPL